MAAISYDSITILKNFSDRKSVGIPLLSDAESTTIRAFGILNDSIPKTSPFFGVPHPVTYIVGPDGVIRSVFHDEDYRKRFTTGAILSDRAPASDTVAPVASGRIQVRTASSDTVVRGGERVRLFVTIILGPRLHVYAPGVEGYIPLQWTPEPSEAVEALPVQFPKSRMLRLKAIKETVPVFERTFELTRDVVIGQPGTVEKLLDASRQLTIRGTLRYQACDDRQCFVPEEVSLQWKLRYEPHDPTRVPAELRRH